MRVAVTIILNGKHHLLHNDYYKFLQSNFDLWVVVDGASGIAGTTGMNCKNMPKKYYSESGGSIDGTVQFLEGIKSKNMEIVKPKTMWPSKENQINAGLDVVRTFTENKQCFLWEIDIDEQWIIQDIEESEKELMAQDAKTGCFLCNYYLGKNIVAKGEWGEGFFLPYRRLWNWGGEDFLTHEPPELKGGNGKSILINNRFNHYAYFFEEDVKFKSEWYKGHESLYGRWKTLKTRNDFPIPISELISGRWGRTKTWIEKI